MTQRASIERLYFVYQADSGLLGATLDSVRKLLRVNGCALCSITHGLAGEKSEWRTCKEELGVPVDYVHRDELSGPIRNAVGAGLPAVVAQTAAGFQVLLTPEVLERCKGSVADLKGRLFAHAAMKGLELPQ